AYSRSRSVTCTALPVKVTSIRTPLQYSRDRRAGPQARRRSRRLSPGQPPVNYTEPPGQSNTVAAWQVCVGVWVSFGGGRRAEGSEPEPGRWALGERECVS